MSFKKIRPGGSEEIFETKVTDGDGKLLDKWKVLKRDFPAVVKILNEKYSLCMKIFLNKKDKKELDWAFR